MELVLEALQLCLLVVLLWEARRLERSVGAAMRRLPGARKFTQPSLSEVLHRGDHSWEHRGWVRLDSPAREQAYNTPGVALRESEELIEGVQ